LRASAMSSPRPVLSVHGPVAPKEDRDHDDGKPDQHDQPGGDPIEG